MDEIKTKQKTFPPSVLPGATIFLASVCVMMVEIVAGRLAARHIGSSLYTWTAVIGVILGGITLGYYIGGRLADRFAARKIICLLLAASSGACIAAIILNNLVSEWTFLWRMDMAQRVLCHIAIVFFIPSTLIGAISPAAIKMALESTQHSGRTLGRMYALGAAGSILGTFLAGFWLIGTIGTVNTLWATAGISADNRPDISAEIHSNAHLCGYCYLPGGHRGDKFEMGTGYRFGNITKADTQPGYAL